MFNVTNAGKRLSLSGQTLRRAEGDVGAAKNQVGPEEEGGAVKPGVS